MTRKIRRGGALAAACMLLFLAAVPKVAYGADAVNTEEDCSMTFSLSSNDGFEELDRLPVSVVLYRVAEVTAGGDYQPEDAYGDVGLDRVNSGTTAAQWEQMAKDAAGIAVPGILDENGRIAAERLPENAGKPYRALTAGGTEEVKEDQLETGMYLVLAFAVDSPEYRYSFAPYLVAVPGNDYDPEKTNTDDWNYDVDVTLKPAREERFGSLEISKNLVSYHEGAEAPFIFQVEAKKTVNGAETVVYSDVVQLAFDAPGDKSVLIENKIPAGASVTVTEIYQGAAYQVSGGDTRTVEVSADRTASAAFTNTYSRQLNGGSSIVNNFQPVMGTGTDGKETVRDWKWTQVQE